MQPMVVSHEWRGTFEKQFWMQGTRDESPFLAAAAALQFFQALGVERCRAYSRALVQWAVQLVIGAKESIADSSIGFPSEFT